MEELKISVTQTTADVLQKMAATAHMPMGEIIDHLILEVAPDDAGAACLVAMEQYMVSISKLSEKDAAKVHGTMCSMFLAALPPEELDNIVASVKDSRAAETQTIQPLSKEEITELRKSANDIFRVLKNDTVRKLLYSLLHG